MEQINEYINNLKQLIEVDSRQNSISEREAFFNYVSDLMLNSGEIQEDISYLHFESEGKARRLIQLDGYCTDSLSSSLILFIVDFESDSTNYLTKTDMVKFYKRVEGYIENIDYITNTCEESSGGYQLAHSIKNEYSEYDKYKIYLITDRVLAHSVDLIPESTINGHSVDHFVWDLNRIFQADNSENGREPITIDLTQYTQDGKGLPCILANKTPDYTAYLCTIPGRVLADLYNKYTGRLLEGNVRSFLQVRGKVNSGIRRTILNEPENFFTYNNGIAGTAIGVSTVTDNGIGYITSITDFQIVNGGQTTASLAACLLNDKKDNSEVQIDKIMVQMKLSVVSDVAKAQELIPNISRYTNLQNAVKTTDMWSNDPLHMRLEKISRSLVTPSIAGRALSTFWYYERARGQYAQETYKLSKKERDRFISTHPKEQLITKTQLGIIANVMDLRPDYASLGGEKSFAKFMENAVKKWKTSDSSFNEEYFRNIVSVQLMFKSAYKYAALKKYDYKTNVAEYTIARLFYELKSNALFQGYTVDLGSIWRTQCISDALRNQIGVIVDIAYNFLTSPNRDVINVTEWAKREKCWEKFKLEPIELSKSFIEELDTIINSKSAQDAARKELRNFQTDNAMIEVSKYGVNGFKKLMDWSNTTNILSASEKQFIDAALQMARGHFPSDKQCVRILQILNRAREYGYLG